MEYAAIVKLATALIYCPIQKAQAEQFLTALQLRPRHRDVTNDMVNTIVAEDIMKEKQRVEEINFEQLRNMGAVVISNDTGHNHSRGSTIAQNVSAVNGRVVCTLVDTVTTAARKEAALMQRFMDLFIKVKGIDVAGVSMDKNRSNAKKSSTIQTVSVAIATLLACEVSVCLRCIFLCTRQNASNSAIQDDAVQPHFETWHEGKDIPGRGKKYAKKARAIILENLKSSFDRGAVFSITTYCQDVASQLKRRADNFFSDISDSFEGKGAAEWKKASKTGGSMLAFAQEHRLVDVQRNVDYSPLIEKINSNRTDKTQISCIEEVNLRKCKLVDLQEIIIFFTQAEATRDSKLKLSKFLLFVFSN
jgi:hypothetical protein